MDLVPLERSLRDFTPVRHMINSRGENVVKNKAYDPLTQRMSGSETTQFENGSIDQRQWSIRLYSVIEMRNLLCKAGFEITKVYGSCSGTEYTMDSGKMIIVAQKSSAGAHDKTAY